MNDITRKPLSKSLRVEVFRRDEFTCQYCGQRPPGVVLEVDHVTPVSRGGTDDHLNLVTSCFDCNRGKGAKDLSEQRVYPDADVKYLETQQELCELQRYQRTKRKRDRALAQITTALQDLWCDTFEERYCPTDGQMHRWLVWAGPEVLERAISTAGYKRRELYDMDSKLRFVGAILRNMVREG